METGTMIDHIAFWQAPKVLETLKLQALGKPVAMLLGHPSSRYQKKDLLFIDNWEPDSVTELKVVLLAPYATINLIRDFQIEKKIKPQLPEIVEELMLCPNPRCITHSEEVPHKIRTVEGRLPFECYYCEFRYSHDQVKFL